MLGTNLWYLRKDEPAEDIVGSPKLGTVCVSGGCC